MSKEHEIAIDVINDEVAKREKFTYESICKEIVSKGGILRVSIGDTIGMYLKNLVRNNILISDNDSSFWSETGNILGPAR